LKLAINNIVI